ncbi:hypothetical protein AAG906_010156 [Vitis piasezkii]
MNSSCLYAGPRTRLFRTDTSYCSSEVNHCCERIESSVLPLEFNGNTDRCIIQSAVAIIQSNVSECGCFASRCLYMNVLGPHQCLRNRLRWMSYL